MATSTTISTAQSLSDDSFQSSGIARSDHLRPVDISKEPILLGDNPAHVEGVLYEVGRFYGRKGLFQPLFMDRAVLLSNGKLAIDSPQALVFINQTVSDPHNFDDPCPPTNTRISNYDEKAAAAGTPAFVRINTIRTPDPIRDQLKDQFVIQPYAVAREDNLLFSSLIQIFESADKATEMEEAAGGSGIELLRVIRLWGATAKPKDRALVTEERNAVVKNGVEGELNLDTFNSYYRKFKRAERFVPPGARLSNETVIQQLQNVMFRDPMVRDLWELTESVSTMHGRVSGSVDELVATIREMLRSRKVSQAIDNVTRGVQSSFITPDPKKGPKKPVNIKQKTFPEARDATGKLVKWVTGMAPCSCGGLHLFRDCPSRPAPSISSRPTQPNQHNTGPTKTSKGVSFAPAPSNTSLVTDVDTSSVNLGEDDLPDELLSFFAFASKLTSQPSISKSLVSSGSSPSGSKGDQSPAALIPNHESGPPAPRARVTHRSNWPVYTFSRQYFQGETLFYYTVNVGDAPGVYYGTWSDVAPLVLGKSAPPGVTTHRKFREEWQAHQFRDHSLEFQALGGRPISFGLSAAERMELRDRALAMSSSGQAEQATGPNPHLQLLSSRSPGSNAPLPPPQSELPPSEPSTAADPPPHTVGKKPAGSPHLSASDFSDIRQTLAARKPLTSQLVAILSIALLSFAVGAFLMASPSLISDQTPLQLPEPPPRPPLRIEFIGQEPPIPTSGSRCSRSAGATIVCGCVTLSLLLTTELRSICWTLINLPLESTKLSLLWMLTPAFATSRCFFRLYEAIAPRRLRFFELVTSAGRLRPLLSISILSLICFSSLCFNSASVLYVSRSINPPSALRPYETPPRSYCRSLVSSGEAPSGHGGPLIYAIVDSGASAGSTDDLSRLISVRQCSEVFGDAGGRIVSCKHVGTLPVGVRDVHGDLISVRFTNVRHVPSFQYTLLSVTQMWKEQKYEARFGNVNCLELKDKFDRNRAPARLPFEGGEKLPTLAMLSLTDPAVMSKTASSLALATAFPQSGLGFHSPQSTSHVGRLSAAQVGELMHRRYHCGVDKIRAIASTTADGTPNIASSPKWTCEHCAGVYSRKASHPGHLTPPSPFPGKLHVDIKGPFSRSLGGYLYAALFIDEFTRMVFFEPLKTKAEIVDATKRVVSKFEATVGVPVDEAGVPVDRPRVFEIRSDHEGGLVSGHFESFRLEQGIHSSLSPPHDHDLNPISEATIRSIDRLAAALRAQSGAPVGFWPYLIRHAVDIHNSTVRPCGSSPANDLVAPTQRFTLRQPKVLDLASFGCRAVVAKPPPNIRKGDLSSRGWVGCFLGRSSQSVGAYDVWVPEQHKMVTSSSVLVDEEHFPWRGGEAKQPLTPSTRAMESTSVGALPPTPLESPAAVSATSGPSNVASQPAISLSFLSLFSGAYNRIDGLAEQLKIRGWNDIIQLDHDPISGGGWADDLLNDEAYSNLLRRAGDGEFHGMMIAVDCSTFSVARFYAASNGTDPGPPPVRTKQHPDGLPPHLLDPRYATELRKANKLLERCVDVAIAARASSAKTTIVFENPADRSIKGTIPYCSEFSDHGSVFATSEFARLSASVVPNELCTFAQCRLGSDAQKYTTLFYTSEAATTLRRLNDARFQCNHDTAHAAVAGGRSDSGEWKSPRFAAYPKELNGILAEAFTRARVGASTVSSMPDKLQPLKAPPLGSSRPKTAAEEGSSSDYRPARPGPASPVTGLPDAPSPSDRNRLNDPPSGVVPISFPSLEDVDLDSDVATEKPREEAPWRSRAARDSTKDWSAAALERQAAREQKLAEARRARASKLNPIAEPRSPLPAALHSSDYADESYEPYVASSLSLTASALEQGACAIAAGAHVGQNAETNHHPITPWMTIQAADKFHSTLLSARAESLSLRADSEDAPETHQQAVKLGGVWLDAERKELDNHSNNQSWSKIRRDELPAGRRLHKLVWVYKLKRDGTAKARLCVQGCTLEPGVDYDQTFSQTLRHSSARSLFALAARLGCSVRSIDYVAAYLQGEFVDGEVVYCYLPSGYEERDVDDTMFILQIKKPIYGIPQAGRRLQRKAFPWFVAQGLSQCSSDECIFVWRPDNGSTEVFAVGVYVDNLQIVHSAALDPDGNASDPNSYLARFLECLRRDWEVVDEGVMEDLLAIQVKYNNDGSITLHQSKYVDKLVAKYQPSGPDASVQRSSLPYCPDVVQHVLDAVEANDSTPRHPSLVREYQERIGALMYLTTSTRPDIAYVTHLLARASAKPTPQLILDTDRVISYLSRHRDVGLTYVGREQGNLEGYSDASWETKNSTSGWAIMWQGAAVSWGSSKQPCVALSSCEAEVVALSESCKDVVYLRKLVGDITGCVPNEPTPLYTDNQAARDLSYNPEHHKRTKHIERRHFFIRDMVEKMELTVPFVAGEDNLADFLTKPLSAKRFATLRRLIMNEQPRV